MFLRSFDEDLALSQVHRPRNFGDIVRATIKEDRHVGGIWELRGLRIQSTFQIPNNQNMRNQRMRLRVKRLWGRFEVTQSKGRTDRDKEAHPKITGI